MRQSSVSLKENIFIILIILTAVFVCYANVLNAPFVWDDEFLILKNSLIRAPLLSFRAFTQDIYNSGFAKTLYYRPAQILCHAVEYRFWGTDPFFFHLTSVFLHFANALLVFFLSIKLLKEKSLAFLVSLVFAVHPANSAAVSYVSSRADLLVFFFSFASILSFCLFRERNNETRFLFLSTAFFAFSLLSKESALILPFLIILADVFFLGDVGRFRIVHHLPNIALAAAYSVLHGIFLGNRYPAGIFLLEGLAANAALYVKMLALFFAGMFMPLGIRARTALNLVSPAMAYFTAGAVIFLFFVNFKDERRKLSFGLLFYAVAFFPMIFTASSFGVAASHWVYLASYGVIVFESFLLRRFPVLALAAVIFYSHLTMTRSADWAGDVSLSDGVLALNGGDNVAVQYKAFGLLKSGDVARALAVMDGIKSSSQDARSWFVRGRLELSAGNIERARNAFRFAAKIDPGYDSAYVGLALVSFREKNDAEGIKFLEKAAALNPSNIEVLSMLVSSLVKAGDEEKALEVALKAKKADPYDYNALMNLGSLYGRSVKIREAAGEFFAASCLYPEKALPCYNLALIFHADGQREEAEKQLREAIRREPGFKPALELLREIERLTNPAS